MDLIAGLKQTLARLGYAKIAYMGLATVLVLAGLYWVSTFSLEPRALLYSGLDPAESAKIGQKLEEMKIPFDVKGDGTTIFVPASQVARTRMQLAGAGLPHQGGSGYELLDQQSPMNMTSFMQRIQRLRALEGELARTIITLDGVKTARVHIVLPERETFSRETPKPTASVAVSMAGPGRLATTQAAAIRLLVAGAVPGLAPDDVSVLDPSGVVLAADDSEAAASNRLNDLKSARERDLQHVVVGLLEPMIGQGKVKVAAAVELDAAREVSHEEKFDPLSQVERSKQVQLDQETSTEVKSQEPVSVGQNLPNQNGGQGSDGGKSSSASTRNGQTINYELSSVRSDRVHEPGELKRLTVAVVVDGVTDDKGAYRPRTQDELSHLSDLVQAAVGYDVNRGDRVTIETMRFLPEPDVGASADLPSSYSLPMGLWSAIGGVLIVLIGGVVLVLLQRRAENARVAAALASPGVAPALEGANRIALTAAPAPTTPGTLLGIRPEAALAQASTPALAAPAEGGSLPAEAAQPQPVKARRTIEEIQEDSLLTTLLELVDKRPDEAAATLRSWIGGNA
jgi:flagellar M-ring protein FliF